jgi:hypothetical protein
MRLSMARGEHAWQHVRRSSPYLFSFGEISEIQASGTMAASGGHRFLLPESLEVAGQLYRSVTGDVFNIEHS